MKGLRAYLFGMLLLAALQCFVILPARAQVTDAPILRIAPVDRMVVDVDLRAGRHCSVWWERDADRFGGYHLVVAAVDTQLLTNSAVEVLQAAIRARDLATLTKARTHSVKDLEAALRPCVPNWWAPGLPSLEPARQRQLDAIAAVAPPPAWIVAPITSGKRPAYVLKPDGTRGAQSGYIDTTITGNGKTAANWCRCDRMRSKETTSSTYCAPVWVEPPATESEPARRVVTLCRKTG
jgi:hypothetical protein